MKSIAVMGYGTVGSGVVELLAKNSEGIGHRAGEQIELKYILDLREFPYSPFEEKFTKDFERILNDKDIQVVAELMGGTNPAYDYVKRCLLAGKSVVTSNKELVAAYGAELLQIALDNNVNFLFEASVGGGIPIIRPLSQCMAANEVISIAGILNGTTNFILAKMIDENMPFGDALTLAQELGYAEKDPSADVDGHDAARKICILASLAFGKHVYPEFVHTEGIRNITLEDVAYAEAMGGVIKLIGMVRQAEGGKLQICVVPMIVGKDKQISSINGVFNGIMVEGDATGDVIFYGKGAGKMPTASAVVADIIDCVKHLKARKYLHWKDCDGSNIEPYENDVTAMYFRVKGDIGNLQNIERIKIKKEPAEEAAFITKPMRVSELEDFKKSLHAQGIEILGSIRLFK